MVCGINREVRDDTGMLKMATSYVDRLTRMSLFETMWKPLEYDMKAVRPVHIVEGTEAQKFQSVVHNSQSYNP